MSNNYDSWHQLLETKYFLISLLIQFGSCDIPQEIDMDKMLFYLIICYNMQNILIKIDTNSYTHSDADRWI